MTSHTTDDDSAFVPRDVEWCPPHDPDDTGTETRTETRKVAMEWSAYPTIAVPGYRTYPISREPKNKHIAAGVLWALGVFTSVGVMPLVFVAGSSLPIWTTGVAAALCVAMAIGVGVLRYLHRFPFNEK